MKTLLFLVPFLLFILATTQLLPFATAADDIVYDIAGQKVQKGVPYYIGPVIWARGGGVKLSDTKNGKKLCPFHVVQDPKEVNQGGHFTFTLNAAKEKYLREEYPLGIDSGSSTSTCNEGIFWMIKDAEGKAPSNFITTGGLFNTAVSCFQVVKYPKPTSTRVHSYLLQHCPSVCGAGPHTCFNVSIYTDNGTRHLASSGTPFEFVFKKA